MSALASRTSTSPSCSSAGAWPPRLMQEGRKGAVGFASSCGVYLEGQRIVESVFQGGWERELAQGWMEIRLWAVRGVLRGDGVGCTGHFVPEQKNGGGRPDGWEVP
mmetsp:Transcript_17422/g.44026  ORF Transcript_17422/g.44026 Transcript_17422/m.44026 type:complete len:106 (-) Transcript_17422:100-417(-)